MKNNPQLVEIVSCDTLRWFCTPVFRLIPDGVQNLRTTGRVLLYPASANPRRG